MNVQQSLVSLRSDLLRRGLPPAYVERAVGELVDHAEDLAAQTPVTESTGRIAQRLGDPRRLADQLVREFQNRTFLGRHPWLTFIVAPIMACFTLWFGGAILAIGLAFEMAIPAEADHVPSAKFWVYTARGVALTATYGTPLLLAYLAVRRARKTGRTRPWAWVAAGVLAAMQLLVSMDLVIDYQHHNMVGVTCRGIVGAIGSFYVEGAATFTSRTPWQMLAAVMTPWQLLQIAIPPAIAFYALRRRGRVVEPAATAIHVE